jgi:hypothetical protein
MACNPQCRKVSSRQGHCSVCHRTFAGVTAFDLHRRGGQCAKPEDIGMIQRDGIWRDSSRGPRPDFWTQR